MKLLIATANLHKIREIRELLLPLKGIEIFSLKQFPNYTPPLEEGKTFAENAILKAEHAAKALQMVALSDDSGLVVPALEGAPGILSKRYAGEEATDSENRKKLLKAMSHLQESNRNAYYECSLALASPAMLIKSVTATCEGAILFQERGRHGFGYDPLFVKLDYDKSFGELDETTKNRVSHRRKAFDKLLPSLIRQCAIL